MFSGETNLLVSGFRVRFQQAPSSVRGFEDPNASGFLIQPPLTEFGLRQVGEWKKSGGETMMGKRCGQVWGGGARA